MKSIIKNLKTIFTICILVITASCSKDESPTSEPNPTPPTDVYIAGATKNAAGINVPTIWKNGVPTILPSDVNVNTAANKVIVSGNDVYAINGGFSGLSTGNSIIIWKNGTIKTEIPNAFAYEFIIDNGNIYILGKENNVSKYWKNGVATILGSLAIVASMKISNNDVYVAGYESNGSKYLAKFWKNGEATTISNPVLDSFASEIAINGSDVCVFFKEVSTTNTISHKLWKNGLTTTLKSGMLFEPGGGNSKMIFEANNLHIVSFERLNNTEPIRRKIFYWKNEVITEITTGINFSDCTDLKVIGSDVYILGLEKNSGATGKLVLKIWRNGLPTALTDGATDADFSSSMFVSANNDIHTFNGNQYFKNNVATTIPGSSARALSVFVVN